MAMIWMSKQRIVSQSEEDKKSAALEEFEEFKEVCPLKDQNLLEPLMMQVVTIGLQPWQSAARGHLRNT